MTQRWREVFPQLCEAASNEGLAELLDRGTEVSLPAGTTVFRQGDHCSNYLLMLQGKVRVFTRTENGREIVLYRLGAGDSCVLTTSCLFGQASYPAEGVTETAVSALQVPAELFHSTVESSRRFREFVFSSFGGHLGSLISLVEQVAFGKLDTRLASHLLSHGDRDGRLQITHQQLATELGSAREVISRLLKEFESKGWLALQRGSILIKDHDALKGLAQQA